MNVCHSIGGHVKHRVVVICDVTFQTKSSDFEMRMLIKAFSCNVVLLRMPMPSCQCSLPDSGAKLLAHNCCPYGLEPM